MKQWTQAILILSVLLSQSALAQTMLSGQVDLRPIQQSINATPEVNLNFGNAIIQGFAEGLRGSNDNLADVLSTVAGLRVMVYDDIESDVMLPLYNETLSQLAFEGWTAAIEIRDDDDQVDVYIKESVDFVDGIMVMVNEQNGDLVFVNIYGALDPVFIGQVISSGINFGDLDLDDLKDLAQQ